jgi:hypothetical protein
MNSKRHLAIRIAYVMYGFNLDQGKKFLPLAYVGRLALKGKTAAHGAPQVCFTVGKTSVRRCFVHASRLYATPPSPASRTHHTVWHLIEMKMISEPLLYFRTVYCNFNDGRQL